MIQGDANINVMKNNIESELSVAEYIAGFTVCDELAIKVKKRNRDAWSGVSSTRSSSSRDFICILLENGDIFICTPDQKVCTDIPGTYKRADKLVATDSVITTSDDNMKIIKTYNMESRTVESVYGLTTCDNAPYYANDVLIIS